MSEAADFAGRFADAWRAPSGDRLAALLHERVHLVQPLMREVHDREGARRAFNELFGLVPDLASETRRFAPTPDGVLIEHTMRGTLAWRPYSWDVVDRIVLEDGLVRERIAYFDSLPVTLESLKKPWKAPGSVRLML